jgi:hypothetical protein
MGIAFLQEIPAFSKSDIHRSRNEQKKICVDTRRHNDTHGGGFRFVFRTKPHC